MPLSNREHQSWHPLYLKNATLPESVNNRIEVVFSEQLVRCVADAEGNPAIIARS